jgi:hypothetical protein
MSDGGAQLCSVSLGPLAFSWPHSFSRGHKETSLVHCGSLPGTYPRFTAKYAFVQKEKHWVGPGGSPHPAYQVARCLLMSPNENPEVLISLGTPPTGNQTHQTLP